MLDVDSYYYLAGECMDCGGCKGTFQAWNSRIMIQLPDGLLNFYLCERPTTQIYSLCPVRKWSDLGSNVGAR